MFFISKTNGAHPNPFSTPDKFRDIIDKNRFLRFHFNTPENFFIYFTIRFPVTIAQVGAVSGMPQLAVTYQVCTDRACLAPTTLVLPVEIAVAGVGP